MGFFSPWYRRRKAWPPPPHRDRPQPGRQWSSWWCSGGTSPWPPRGSRGHSRRPRRYREPTPAEPSSSCRRKKNQEPMKNYSPQVENFHSVRFLRRKKFDLTFSHSVVWEYSLSQDRRKEGSIIGPKRIWNLNTAIMNNNRIIVKNYTMFSSGEVYNYPLMSIEQLYNHFPPGFSLFYLLIW